MIDINKDTAAESPADGKRKRTGKPWLKITLLSILALGFLGVAGGAGYAYYLIKDTPDFNPQAFSNLSSTTNVYDRNGNQLGSMQTDGNRELIKDLSQVSPFVVDALIAAEDKTFYDNFGVNPLAIMRAVYQNFIGGGIVSGASTITQQTVKLVVFPAQEQTVQRKLQEMYLAVQVNKAMTKQEIMVHYLNWIYFGKSGSSNLYGIQAASKAIFGKDAKDLNLAQASLLAAMVNNPSKYSPYTRLDKALEYQDYVLNEMLQANKITESEYKEARAFDIQASIVKPQVNLTAYGKYPYVIQETEERAAESLMSVAKYDNLDDARQALFKGGYKVYTSIDAKLQDSVDAVMQNPNLYYPQPITYKAKDGSQVKDAMQQAGAMLIDNSTGAILAFGGGRDFKQNQNNHAAMTRQPGSTMKPIGVYGPAIEKKQLSPGSVIDDVPMQLDNGPNGKYFPMNHDHQFHGFVSVRDALKQSYNIPAIKTTQLITPKVGLDYVRKMGAQSLPKEDEHLVSGIGGLSQGLTVEEATSAFSTFPNGGVHKPSYLVTKIVDRNGKVVFEQKAKEDKVFTPQTAFLVTDLLKDVVKPGGTGSAITAHFPGKAIAGKTGTTDNTTDSWFVGYTPNVTLGVWVGYDIPYPMDQLPGSVDRSGLRSINIWNSIMDQVVANLPQKTESFAAMPSGIVRREYCTKSGMIPTDLCREAGTVATDLFVVGNEPKEPCDKMVKAQYVEINGKKYPVNSKTTAMGGQIKTGIFFKRDPYVLPYGDARYRPKDYLMELPKDFAAIDSDNLTATPAGELTVTDSSATSVSLSWQPVPGADGYVVLRSISPTGPFSSISDILQTTEFTDRSVKADTVYYYQVSSVSGGKLNPAGPTVQASTGNTVRLQAPAGLTAVGTQAGNSLSWQPVNGAAEYVVYRSTDGSSFTPIASVKGTSYQDAVSASKNWYKVSAKNASGESPLSAGVLAEIGGKPPAQAPAAPTASISNTGPKALKVSWNAVPGAVVYIVERSTGAEWVRLTETSGTSISEGNLAPNINYSYRVRAVNSAGDASAPSNIVSSKM